MNTTSKMKMISKMRITPKMKTTLKIRTVSEMKMTSKIKMISKWNWPKQWRRPQWWWQPPKVRHVTLNGVLYITWNKCWQVLTLPTTPHNWHQTGNPKLSFLNQKWNLTFLKKCIAHVWRKDNNFRQRRPNHSKVREGFYGILSHVAKSSVTPAWELCMCLLLPTRLSRKIRCL